MTFSVGHVQNGTGAGWRRTRDKKYVTWECSCPASYVLGWERNVIFFDGKPLIGKRNPGYLKKCIDCGTPRDQ